MCVAAFLAQESLKLRYYSSLGPGPGFFPFWLSIFLAILAAAMFLKATFGKAEAIPANFYADRRGYLRIGAIVAAIVGAIVLMEPLGFRLTMLGFYLFLLTILRRQHPLVNGIIAFVGSFGVYQVFDRWLATPLPAGMFGF